MNVFSVSFLKRHELWILMGLFLLTFFLRIYRFEDRIDWAKNFDQTRDIFVAEHMVRYGEMPVSGHISSGNRMLYPPFYYYFLGALALFFPHHVWITIAVIAVISTTSLWIYGIGKNVASPFIGLLAAILYAMSLFMIDKASVLSVNVGVPFFTCGVFAVFSKNQIFRYIGYGFLLCSGVIHASGFVGAALVFGTDILTRKYSIRNILGTLFFMLYCIFLLFFPFIIASGPSVLIRWFSVGQLIDTSHAGNTFFRSIGMFWDRWYMLFGMEPFDISVIVGSFVCLFCTFFAFFGKQRKIISILAFNCLLFFLFGAMKKGEFQSWYFDYVYPFLFLFIGIVIVCAGKQISYIRYGIGVLCMLMMSTTLFVFFTRPPAEFTSKKIDTIVSHVLVDAKKQAFAYETVLITGMVNFPGSAYPVDFLLSMYAISFEERTGIKMTVSGLERDGVHMPTYVVHRSSGYEHVYYICLAFDKAPKRCIGDIYRGAYVFEKEIESPDEKFRIFLFKRMQKN